MAENDEPQDEIARLDIDQTLEWLEREGVLDEFRSLNEMHDKIREILRTQTAPYNETAQSSGQEKFNAEMNTILTKTSILKEQLVFMYDAVISLLSETVSDDVKEHTYALYGRDIRDKLLKYKNEVSSTECPIVVAGETSAGKSSFLNLLLGENMLPVADLCATSTLCHIHALPPDAQCYFVVTLLDSSKRTFEGSKHDLIKKLEPYVTKRNDTLRIKQVDIFWHVPLLGSNQGQVQGVTLVDTPGVGENQPLSEQVFQYLPNAAAFIYVINSANAGGVQTDKLIQIFRHLKLDNKQGGLFSFDPQCTMFVCNKWDRVQGSEHVEANAAERVWEDTVNKLNNHLPGVSSEKNMYKLSTTKEMQYLKTGIGYTEQYRFVLAGLNDLIVASLSGKVTRHYRWLVALLEHIKSYIVVRVKKAHMSRTEKSKWYQDVSDRLKKLRSDGKKAKYNMDRTCREKCHEMASKLHEHIHSSQVQARLRRRINMEEIMSVSENPFNPLTFDIKAVHIGVLHRLAELIPAEVHDWECHTGFIQRTIKSIKTDFEQNYLILNDVSTQVTEASENDIASDNANDNGSESTIGDKLLLAAILPIAIPLGIVGIALGIALMPFTIPFLIKTTLAKGEFVRNKDQHLNEWCSAFMNTLNTDVLNNLVVRMFFAEIQNNIEQLSERIPKQIQAGEKLVNEIMHDRRSANAIEAAFLPSLTKIHNLTNIMQELQLKWVSKHNIDVCRIRRIKEREINNYALVYEAQCLIDDCECNVALKIIHTTNVQTAVECIENLKKLTHDNVVGFIGFCYSNIMPGMGSGGSQELLSCNRLMLLSDMCEITLQDYVFANPDKLCGNPNGADRNAAFLFFRQSGFSVCKGLKYIHDNGLVHRDLKLKTTMMQTGVVKISLPKLESSQNKTVRRSHVAPELACIGYTKETDVFDLATLLWELWYGRCTDSVGHLYENLGSKTDIPDCSATHVMPDGLAHIVKQCWEDDPQKRPSLTDVQLVVLTTRNNDVSSSMALTSPRRRTI